MTRCTGESSSPTRSDMAVHDGNLQEYRARLKNELAPLFQALRDCIPDEPEGFRPATLAYLDRGGKLLRPALVCLAAGVCGGAQAARRALPIAAAVEVLHVMTLVHDDIIDDDPRRHGGPSVHTIFQQQAADSISTSGHSLAPFYGKSMAILAGDVLHAAAVWMALEHAPRYGIPPEIVNTIVTRMEGNLFPALIAGQALDTWMGTIPLKDLVRRDIQDISRMAHRINALKTARLLSFAAYAGALIGLQKADERHPWVRRLESFGSQCGMAFQIRDDILGIVGDSRRLGKPVGSDIREGKKTLLLACVLATVSGEHREILIARYGEAQLDRQEVEELRSIIMRSGCIEKLNRESAQILSRAKTDLQMLPTSSYHRLLAEWADYVAARQY